jgi:hypothetical protein
VNTRRLFFRQFLGQTVASIEEVAGRPQISLAQLPTLPDDDLGRLMPGLRDDVRVEVQDARVQAWRADRAAAVTLFEAGDAEAVRLFNRFDGHTTLDDIARALALEEGGSAGAAFARARALFLRLVELGVCVPQNAPADTRAERASSSAAPGPQAPRP